MATTILQAFQKLKENTEITNLQATAVSTRQQNVRDVVMKEMTVLTSFLTGSYRRNTMIAPLNEADVDVFIVLDPSYFDHTGHTSLLDRVKQVLTKQYSTSTIGRDGQAITIKFADFKIDVVPGFYRDGGGYLIPDSIGKRWIDTDPTKHVDLWSQRNISQNGDFVPLIKMLKCWNKMHSQTLRSFHLESLAYEVLTNVTISDFPSGVRYFFDKARNKILSGTLDPAGYGGDIGSYLDSPQKKYVAISKLVTAYDNATEAERLQSQGKTQEAYVKWGIIFGDYFPAYF